MGTISNFLAGCFNWILCCTAKTFRKSRKWRQTYMHSICEVHLLEVIGTASRSDGARAWRWSGPSTTSTVVLPTLGAKRIKLELGLIPTGINPDALENLDVVVDGQALRLASSLGIHSCEIELPPLVPLGKFVVKFIVPRTVAPNAIDSLSGDARKLGFGLTLCRVTRIE